MKMQIDHMKRLTAAALIAAVGCAASVAAQDSQAKPSEESKPAESAPPKQEGGAEKKPESLPSLDDLLGIPGEKKDSAEGDEEAVEVDEVDPTRAELERALEGVDVSEAFAEAVRQMGDAADLLEVARDPGVRTQRLQDEILRKLDILIEKAEQQSSSSSSSSSSQSQSQQQQQQPSQQQQPQQSNQRQSGEPQEGMPPGGQEGDLNDVMDAARAAWGALPQRVRDALVEGTNESFSSMYKTWTEAYYRRLAEEAGDK
ncbi:MAG: hypothetical protein VYC34_07465 [Planctomycetota bacterium]|nr:hypothetical protein [Planctomycetota bacterium]